MCLSVAREAWGAPCTEWDAGFSVDLHANRPSEAFTYNWSAVTECDEFSFDHYLVCRLPGSTAPATPSSSGAVCRVNESTISTVTQNDAVHCSLKQYAARIFACQDSGCTEYYGDGSTGSTVSNDDDDETTEQEIWVLEDITSLSDSDRVIADSMASAALFYPTGFDNAGKLAIWWDYNDGDNHHIAYKRATSTGQLDWNTTTDWTSDVDIAIGTDCTSGCGDFTDPTHPWVVAATDGSNEFIRLFMHTGEFSTTPHVISMDSTDEDGTQFGIECACTADTADTAGCTCTDGCPDEALCDYEDETGDGGEAEVAICADGTSSCAELAGARHGRIMWSYLGTPIVNFGSHEPAMVFTGELDDDDCPNLIGDSNDVFRATWDSTNTEWDVFMNSGCPAAQWVDRHDPGVFPLPGGEYKMYAQSDPISGNKISVIYWDGDSWEDEQNILVHLDGDTTDQNGCIGNVDVLVWKSGATVVEMMFAEALEEVSCFSASGIVYLEHTN